MAWFRRDVSSGKNEMTAEKWEKTLELWEKDSYAQDEFKKNWSELDSRQKGYLFIRYGASID